MLVENSGLSAEALRELTFCRALCIGVGILDIVFTVLIISISDFWLTYLVSLIPLILGLCSFNQARKIHRDIERQRYLHAQRQRWLYGDDRRK